MGKLFLKNRAGKLRLNSRIFCGAAIGILLLLLFCHVPAEAAPLTLPEVRREFKAAVKNNKTQVTFTTSPDYTGDQLLKQLSKAALNQGKLYTGGSTYQRKPAGKQVQYTFRLPKKAFLKVKLLKTKKAAYKAALKALQNRDYTTRFYSSKSYYSVFRLMLRQHPEYNYNTIIWKNQNGTYGYRISSHLTKAQLNAKWQAADRAAAEFVKNKLKKGMSVAEKVHAIHDYVIRVCNYDYDLKNIEGYKDSLTAYGVLVKNKGVCQGYTAAFNLLAQRAGIYSIAVCGSVSTGTHTWNYVKTGNKYRYVDCSWDETLQTGTSLRHDYLLVEKSLIDPHHVWDEKKFASKYIAYCKYLK